MGFYNRSLIVIPVFYMPVAFLWPPGTGLRFETWRAIRRNTNSNTQSENISRHIQVFPYLWRLIGRKPCWLNKMFHVHCAWIGYVWMFFGYLVTVYTLKNRGISNEIAKLSNVRCSLYTRYIRRLDGLFTCVAWKNNNPKTTKKLGGYWWTTKTFEREGIMQYLNQSWPNVGPMIGNFICI